MMTESGVNGVTVSQQYDWGETNPSIAIVEAVADLEGTEPAAVEVTLHEHVDADALDILLSNGRYVSVSFTLGEYHVRIDGDVLTVTGGEGDRDVTG
jgi:hypothetical protein